MIFFFKFFIFGRIFSKNDLPQFQLLCHRSFDLLYGIIAFPQNFDSVPFLSSNHEYSILGRHLTVQNLPQFRYLKRAWTCKRNKQIMPPPSDQFLLQEMCKHEYFDVFPLILWKLNFALWSDQIPLTSNANKALGIQGFSINQGDCHLMNPKR